MLSEDDRKVLKDRFGFTDEDIDAESLEVRLKMAEREIRDSQQVQQEELFAKRELSRRSHEFANKLISDPVLKPYINMDAIQAWLCTMVSE